MNGYSFNLFHFKLLQYRGKCKFQIFFNVTVTQLQMQFSRLWLMQTRSCLGSLESSFQAQWFQHAIYLGPQKKFMGAESIVQI